MLRQFTIFFAFLGLAFCLISCDSKTSSGSSSGKSENKEPLVEKSSMYLALSFDDGPNTSTTAKVLDVLEEFGVPASFFVIGQNINEESAKQMRRAIEMGCDIENHSYTHSFMSKLSSEEVIDEITKTDQLIKKYTGTIPQFFRPPYIDHNEQMHQVIAHTFICGVGCSDWEASRSAQNRYDDLVANVKDGDIILLHDFEGNDNTVQALKMFIPEMQKRGYSFVTVPALFEIMGISPKSNDGKIYTSLK